MRRGLSFLLCVACVAAGAALNVYRASAVHAPARPLYHGFCAPPEMRARDMRALVPGLCGIEIADEGWRPLRIAVPVKARHEGDAIDVRIGLNDQLLDTIRVGSTWTTKTLDLDAPAQHTSTLTLRIETTTASIDGPPPVDVGPVDVTRVQTRGRVLALAAIGGLIGAITWFVAVATRRYTDARATESAADARAAGDASRMAEAHRRQRAFLAATALLFAYFALWALLRPPYQTPDEVQHHLRTTSVLREPWIAGPGHWSLDPRFTNPLARWPPRALDKLFFDPDQRLTRGEIAELQAMPWPDSRARPAPETYSRPIASYPTLYYLALFAIAEPLTRGLAATPYQSVYLYRLVSALLAALLWAAVYRALQRTDATRDVAAPLLAFLVLNPMVAFMSSAINPDGVNIPLATLAIVLLWRVMRGDDGMDVHPDATRRAAWVALIATAWTKPSGLQLAAAFVPTAALFWITGQLPRARIRTAIVVAASAMLVAWCGFYAWSPPRFFGGPPVVDTVATYVGFRWSWLPETWVQYWGRLGWLEYALPMIWYQALVALAIVSAACAIARPLGSRLFVGFTAAFLAVFLVVTFVAEFFYLPTSGYFLQGRHLLPASIGLAGLVMHRVKPVRITLLGLLAVMNVLLLHETVLRYYTRGWSAVLYALPFGR